MARIEVVSLQRVAPMLGLEVEHEAIHFTVNDLVCPEEPKIGGLSMNAGRNLELRLPGRVDNPAQDLRELELPRVPQRRGTAGIPTDDHIDTHGSRDGAEGVKLRAGITVLDAPQRVRGDAG